MIRASNIFRTRPTFFSKLEVLENLNHIDRETYIPAYNFAIIYTGLGDLDKAFEWFEQARKERSGFFAVFES